MTQSVVEKTSIPEKTWRRQTDSPFGWITFVCGSLILHLLAFWLISLYKLSASQSGSDLAVPIEFIEISPQKSSPVQPKPKPKPKPKAVIPKPSKPILPQNSQPPALPKVVKPPVITNDQDAIAFDNQKIEQQLAEQQRQQELLQQQLAEQQRQLAEKLRQRQAQQEQLEVQLRQQEIEQQQKLAEQLRQQEQEQKRQLQAQRQQEQQQKRQLQAQRQQEQEQKRQEQAQRQEEREQKRQEQVNEQRRLAQQSKLEADEQRRLATQEQQNKNPLDGEKIANAPTNARGEAPEQREKAPQAPIPNQSNQSGGILTANWNIEPEHLDDIPANLAKPQKRVNSDIPLPPPKDGNLQLGDFLVWLTIDNQGNLLFIKVDQTIPVALRSQYQEYAEKIFNGQKFIPASDSNGNKPELSNLPIRVNIQSSSN